MLAARAFLTAVAFLAILCKAGWLCSGQDDKCNGNEDCRQKYEFLRGCSERGECCGFQDKKGPPILKLKKDKTQNNGQNYGNDKGKGKGKGKGKMLA